MLQELKHIITQKKLKAINPPQEIMMTIKKNGP